MDEHSLHLKRYFEIKQKSEDRQRELSKEKLLKATKKKIQTTMIGALHSVEQHFGFLWDSGEIEPSYEQLQLKEIFEDLRSEILDRGNNQIRNLENEFINYNIIWKKYSLKLPFTDKGE
jgi:transcription termination factor Rho